MITELTGMPVSNASLLDEATAAAEAMFMSHSLLGGRMKTFFASEKLFPQTLALLKTRAKPLGINLEIGDPNSVDFSTRKDLCGVMVQLPDLEGKISDWEKKAAEVHKTRARFIVI